MEDSASKNGKSDCELGFMYVRRNSTWKRLYLVISHGNLNFFSSSEKKNGPKISISIVDSSIQIAAPDSMPSYVGDSSVPFCSKFLTQPLPLECHSSETCLVIIQPFKGKALCLLAMNQKTAKSWKIKIEESKSVESSQTKDKRKKSLDKNGSFKMLSKASSAVKRSIGLKKKLQSNRDEMSECLNDTSVDCSAVQDVNVDCSAVQDVNSLQIAPTNNMLLDPLWPQLESLDGCADFLRSNYLHVSALDHARFMIDHFKGCYQMGDSSLSDEFRLEAWKGTIRRIIRTLVDQLLNLNPSLETCNDNDEHMDQLWLACETWILGAVHDKIMGACKQMFSIKDKMIYENMKHLEKVDPKVLGIQGGIAQVVLGESLLQFKQLNRFKTPLEKAICIRKTINLIMEGIQRMSSANTLKSQDSEENLTCTDDLLSFIVLLMVNSKVQSLQANACYMETFLYTNRDDGIIGELGFHVTNFVAACNYLQSREISEIKKLSVPDKHLLQSCSSQSAVSTANYDASSPKHNDSACKDNSSGLYNKIMVPQNQPALDIFGEAPDFLLASTYQ